MLIHRMQVKNIFLGFSLLAFFILASPAFAASAYPQNSLLLITPNGGETFTFQDAITVQWTGGKNKVQVGLLQESNDIPNNILPGYKLMGWIEMYRVPNDVYVWSAKKVCDLMGQTCRHITPGRYKILLVSEDNDGNFTISARVRRGETWEELRGNWDISDKPFTIKGAELEMRNAKCTPLKVYTGKPLRCTAYVMNTGTQDVTTPFEVGLPNATSITIPSLKVGGKKMVEANNVILGSPGPFRAFFRADAFDVIEEGNEQNDAFASPVNVLSPLKRKFKK